MASEAGFLARLHQRLHPHGNQSGAAKWDDLWRRYLQATNAKGWTMVDLDNPQSIEMEIRLMLAQFEASIREVIAEAGAQRDGDP
jgi:hypothetical protein